jgi:hypothetical protein
MQATITSYITEKDIEAQSSSSSSSNKDKTYVAYKIRCKLDDTEWDLSKRYSEFHHLQKQLLKVAGGSAQKALAKFPPKLVFGNLKESNIAKRKFNLQVWLDSVLTNEELYDIRDVHEFLETKKHVSNFSGKLANGSSSSGSTQTAKAVRANSIPVSSGIRQELVKALFDYKKNDDSEIGFDQGDVLLVVQKDNSGWWYGRIHSKANGSPATSSTPTDMNELNGFFPSNYVTPLETSSDESAKPIVRKKVRYDYQADPASLKTTHKELSIKTGEIVILIESGPENNGWCFVQKENKPQEEGWIPEDYLDKNNL